MPVGIFDRFGIEYIASYDRPNVLRRLNVYTRAIARLVVLLLGRRVSLVYLHTASRGSFWRKSLLAAIVHLLRIPYVLHIHSGEFTTFYEKECRDLAKWWVRRTLRYASRIICLTESWRVRLLDINSAFRVVVIGNPVSIPEPLCPLRPHAREVLFLGRLREKKGVRD